MDAMLLALRFNANAGDILEGHCDSTNGPSGHELAPPLLPLGPLEDGSKWSSTLEF